MNSIEQAPASRIVVLMATYNGQRYLRDQIETILAQRDVDVRLIVRDDGSTDDTPALLQEMMTVYPDRIDVVRDGYGASGSAAANFGMLLTDSPIEAGDWIALSDQDDIWFPDKLVRAIEHARDKGADCYSSNLIAFSDEAGQAWTVQKDQPGTAFDHLFQGASAGCTYVFSTRALAAIRAGIQRAGGKIPNDISHDWLIYAICRSAGLRWAMDRQARIAYRQHADNVYGTQSGLAVLRGRLKLIRSGWYRRNVMWLSGALTPSAGEQEIFERVTRLSLGDRLWLMRRATSLRRGCRDVAQLRLALMVGLF